MITDFGTNGSLTEIFMHHMPKITHDNLEYINALNEIISIMVLSQRGKTALIDQAIFTNLAQYLIDLYEKKLDNSIFLSANNQININTQH